MATMWNRMASAGLLALALGWSAAPAQAALLWNWSYGGGGISASGTFTTGDTPDGAGFYSIVGITGSRNGVSITGLHPAGSPIPGNAPFAVDNLLSATGSQLKADGFGYALADGSYANVFFASFLPTPSAVEFLSAPPIGSGNNNLGPEDSELQVNFSASPARMPVPEPAGLALVAIALAALQWTRRRPRLPPTAA